MPPAPVEAAALYSNAPTATAQIAPVGQPQGGVYSNALTAAAPIPFTVDARFGWQLSPVTVLFSQRVAIRYEGGTWTADPNSGYYDAEGHPNKPNARLGYVFPNAREGGLIAKIGDNGPVIFIGRYREFQSQWSGPLYFVINDDWNGMYSNGVGFADNNGKINITIIIV